VCAYGHADSPHAFVIERILSGQATYAISTKKFPAHVLGGM
jgi:hypothetical protein